MLILLFLVLNSFMNPSWAFPPSDCVRGLKSETLSHAQNFELWTGSGDRLLIKVDDKTYSRNVVCAGSISLPTLLKRVISLSTTHLAYLNLIGKEKSLIGHSLPEALPASFKNLPSVGLPVNAEKTLALHPDVVFAYRGEGNKLLDLKMLVVWVHEFKEQSALARAEWVKFFGAILGELPKARQEFQKIQAAYVLSNPTTKRPKVLVGNAESGIWIVPGGKSDLAKVIRDAGGEYLFEKDEHQSSLYLSWEEILKRVSEVDVWLPHNYWTGLAGLDHRYSLIKARAWNNNKGASKGSYHPYWASHGTRPDLLLEDLKNIFNQSGKELNWYQKL